MGSIRLHTPFRRKTDAGHVFADVGETLIVGTEITEADAAKLLDRDPPGAERVDSDAADPLPAPVAEQAKAKAGK